MPNCNVEFETEIKKQIAASARTIATVGPSLPTIESLTSELADAERATERGYFLPDEDERIRTVFAHYLRTRAALISSLDDLRPLVSTSHEIDKRRQLFVFAIGFCSACMLIRSGRFIVDSFRKNRVVWKKLNEPAPRFGIPKKQFTHIYRSLTSPRNIYNFLSAVKYYEDIRPQLEELADDETIGPVIQLLREEEPFIETSKRYFAKGRLKYRWHSFLRRHQSGFKNVTFALFKVSGSVIAEMRNHWKRKRVTPGVQRKLSRILEPGDVIITRHDDATTNLFLPGFWPHGALYIGTVQQRSELGIQMDEERTARSADPVCVLEARKDGVLFRELSDTLAVDCCVVIRPKLDAGGIRDAITCAVTHEGKYYDFEFDFRRSNKLVCTEVIYRAYHGIGHLNFQLTNRSGRVCLSAEDLLDHAVAEDFFEVVAIYGVNGNRFHLGEQAKNALVKSYKKM